MGRVPGGGIFVTTVVAGSIFLSQPFKVMERPFLRDLTFYLFAAFWAFYLFFVQEITLKHAIGFIALYMVYIVTVILSRFIYQRYKKANLPAPTPEPTIPTIKVDPAPTEEKSPVPSRRLNDSFAVDDPENEGVVLRRFSYRTSMAVPRKRAVSLSHKHHRESSIQQILRGMDLEKPSKVPDPEAAPCPPPLDPQVSKTSLASLLSQASDDLKMSPLQEFLYQVAPLDVEVWAEAPWYSRCLMIFKLVCQSLYSPSTDVVVFQSPVYLVLTLTVPVVDYENYKNNWCRWLNVIHCVTVPLFLMTISHSTYSFIVVIVEVMGDVAALTWMLGPVPLGAVIGAASLALAIAVYATSKHDAAPRYHALFGYMGFATSVGWIYCIANEIVAVIKTVGVVFKLSDAILGLTVLAWGNSVGDFISNLSVARQGYPRMGISACYGGPLLSIL
ncbi:SLC8B1 [Cordylochernes scorpioides]|uniref:SLC8B1 n=1 Tax=Cordylochernes scorpioides TaxID=51811 RepID=A0ABY6KSY8_9ARAC|nr:SLC8B1 [Cordylochernes scorpioides]